MTRKTHDPEKKKTLNAWLDANRYPPLQLWHLLSSLLPPPSPFLPDFPPGEVSVCVWRRRLASPRLASQVLTSTLGLPCASLFVFTSLSAYPIFLLHRPLFFFLREKFVHFILLLFCGSIYFFAFLIIIGFGSLRFSFSSLFSNGLGDAQARPHNVAFL